MQFLYSLKLEAKAKGMSHMKERMKSGEDSASLVNDCEFGQQRLSKDGH